MNFIIIDYILKYFAKFILVKNTNCRSWLIPMSCIKKENIKCKYTFRKFSYLMSLRRNAIVVLHISE